jgi:hypothetical protein
MNCQEKIKIREKLIMDLQKNPYDKQTSLQEWYKKYMPFLPDSVLEAIPQIEKEAIQIKQQEETIQDINKLFENPQSNK